MGCRARADKITVEYETRGLELVTNEGGEVIGVVADQNGRKVALTDSQGGGALLPVGYEILQDDASGLP